MAHLPRLPYLPVIVRFTFSPLHHGLVMLHIPASLSSLGSLCDFLDSFPAWSHLKIQSLQKAPLHISTSRSRPKTIKTNTRCKKKGKKRTSTSYGLLDKQEHTQKKREKKNEEKQEENIQSIQGTNP